MNIKKFKKCIIHIGSPKTGTSSIQRCFYQNRGQLKKDGYLYPHRANHIFLVSNFSANPARFDFNIKKGRVSQEDLSTYHNREMKLLETSFEETDAHTLIISSEYFMNVPQASLNNLKRYLAAWVDEFEIVCYIRHPLAHARSSIQQHVKAGFSSLNQHSAPVVSKFSNILERYSSVFGMKNISIREFHHDTLYKKDVVSDFAHKMNIKEELIDKMKGVSANESTSMEALLISSAITEKFPRSKDGIWNPERAKSIGVAAVKGQKFSLTQDQIDSVKQRSKPEINYLLNTFGFTFSPITEKPNETSHLWGEDALLSLATLINNKSKIIEKLETPIIDLSRFKKNFKALEVAYQQLSNTSIRQFKAILENDPTNIPAIKALIQFYQKSSDKDMRDLFAYIQECAASDAKHTYTLALFFQDRGNVQFAKMLLTSCNGKGWIYRRKAKKMLAKINTE